VRQWRGAAARARWQAAASAGCDGARRSAKRRARRLRTRDDAVEGAALVVQRLARLADALLAGAAASRESARGDSVGACEGTELRRRAHVHSSEAVRASAAAAAATEACTSMAASARRSAAASSCAEEGKDAQRAEVLDSLGRSAAKEAHLDAAQRLAVHANVKVDDVRHLGSDGCSEGPSDGGGRTRGATVDEKI